MNDISLCGVLQYVRPIGEELQHQTVGSDTVCLHSDSYILTRLSEMKISQNMVDIITTIATSIASNSICVSFWHHLGFHLPLHKPLPFLLLMDMRIGIL